MRIQTTMNLEMDLEMGDELFFCFFLLVLILMGIMRSLNWQNDCGLMNLEEV